MNILWNVVKRQFISVQIRKWSIYKIIIICQSSIYLINEIFDKLFFILSCWNNLIFSSTCSVQLSLMEKHMALITRSECTKLSWIFTSEISLSVLNVQTSDQLLEHRLVAWYCLTKYSRSAATGLIYVDCSWSHASIYKVTVSSCTNPFMCQENKTWSRWLPACKA